MTGPRNIVLHGSRAPTQQLQTVRAGRLAAELDGIDLRYIREGGVEFVRRTYVAVRDPAWGTIPAEIRDLELETSDESFSLRFSARNTDGEIDFSWDGSIVGSSDSVITLSLDGVATRRFEYARIGFCILHPVGAESAARYRARTANGEARGELPLLVAPQPFEGGVYIPMIDPLSEIELQPLAGGDVRITFEGDLWEIEDQRNWTDASFKSYSTPMSLGYPHTLDPKGCLRQLVRIASGARARSVSRPWPSGPVRVEVGAQVGVVPEIGLTVSDGDPPTPFELATLRAVSPAYVRGSLDLAADWEPMLAQVRATADPLGVPIELVLGADRDRPELFDKLRDALRDVSIARVLVFVRGAVTATPDETSPPDLVALARERLRLDSPVGGGTAMEFCELNRTRPIADAMDGIAFSIVAQVHSSDDLSVAETAWAQASTVETLKTFSSGKPIHVGPITFRYPMPFESSSVPPTLPDSVDPRQLSLFGAAWTAASIGSLARAGVASLTYFETLGWRGVVERERGSEQPDVFPSNPGQLFPLAHVLSDACEWRGRATLGVIIDRPFELGVLAVDGGLLVSNLSPGERIAEIASLEGTYAIRRLDESNYKEATSGPEPFRASGEEIEAHDGLLSLALQPFETVRLEHEW